MIKNPSKYQSNIFQAYKETNSNLVIEAVPGSGKTTVLTSLLEFVPKDKEIGFLAFNKAIVEELQKKVANKSIKISTLHSLGASLCFKNIYCKVKIAPYKNFVIFGEVEKKEEWVLNEKERGYRVFICSQIIDMAKLALLADYSYQSVQGLADYYGIDYENGDIDRAIKVLEYLKEYDLKDKPGTQKMINFADMIYLPNVRKMKYPQFDELFIDECQDLNNAQKELIWKILKPTGRFIAVGDKRQCIYSFLGSNPESFDLFAARPNTLALPLSVSYRCGKSIVRKVNTVYDVVEAWEDATEGIVDDMGIDSALEQANSKDFVLCRNNQPLVETYLEFLKIGKKAFIKGRDYGDELYKLVENVGPDDDVKGYFAERMDKLKVKLEAKGVVNYQKHHTYRYLLEKMDIINILLNKFETIQIVRDELKKIFVDNPTEGVILSTIHKSKGLETDRVFILKPELIPSSYAEKPWEIEQEHNLLFVAFSRARKHLTIIKTGGEDE